LKAERNAETLDDREHAELVCLSDQIEADHARRMDAVVKLARLRNVGVKSLTDR
jgi:hypothetical protein